MTGRFAICLVSTLIGCLFLAASCTESGSQSPAPREPVLSTVGDNGWVRFKLELDPPAPELNGFFEVRTVVEDADTGEPIVGALLTLDITMPEHGHGMMTRPKSTELGGGRHETLGSKLHMYGDWVIEVALESGDRTDRALIEYPFHPPPVPRGSPR